MSFQWPAALLLLVIVPLAAAGYVAVQRGRSGVIARFTNPALYPGLAPRRPGRRRHLPAAILLVALTALLVGVARPQANVSVQQEDATIVLAIDVSRSMVAKDVAPTRLGAAQAAARAFLAEVPAKYRVGVVAFATRANVVAPATRDREAIRGAIRNLRPGEGTAIGEGIVRSIEVAKKAGATGVPQSLGDAIVQAPAAILLLSDGAQTQGSVTPDAAAGRAREEHIPVYTVALGTPNGVVERALPGGFRERIRVPPDAETLRRVAATSRAEFFAAPDVERLEQVYADLASRLGRTTHEREITFAFAAAGGLLAVVAALLSELWFRRLP